MLTPCGTELKRKPDLQRLFDDAIEAADSGNLRPLVRFLAEAIPDAPEAGPLLIEVQQLMAWHEAWSQTTTVLGKVEDGELIPPVEICKTYGLAVFVLQMCCDPTSHVPSSDREMFKAWWNVVADSFGDALAPVCEQFAFDPTPLLTVGIDPSLSNSIQASSLVKRLLLRLEQPLAPVEDRDGTTHSPDFTSVNWYGKRYTFAKGNQAQAVKVLWEAWEKDGHSLGQETISQKIESSAGRFQLAKVFRIKAGGKLKPHPAWGTMIVREGKGCYRLAEPTKKAIKRKKSA